MLTVRCPKCSHDMLYQPSKGYVVGKKKRCVYCGATFSVHSDLMSSRIVQEGKSVTPNMPLF